MNISERCLFCATAATTGCCSSCRQISRSDMFGAVLTILSRAVMADDYWDKIKTFCQQIENVSLITTDIGNHSAFQRSSLDGFLRLSILYLSNILIQLCIESIIRRKYTFEMRIQASRTWVRSMFLQTGTVFIIQLHPWMRLPFWQLVNWEVCLWNSETWLF